MIVGPAKPEEKAGMQAPPRLMESQKRPWKELATFYASDDLVAPLSFFGALPHFVRLALAPLVVDAEQEPRRPDVQVCDEIRHHDGDILTQ